MNGSQILHSELSLYMIVDNYKEKLAYQLRSFQKYLLFLCV